LEKPDTFVKLYGILGRIRLVAADPVLAAAEACCRQIGDLYAKPNLTVEQLRVAIPPFRRGRCRLTGGIALCLCGGQNSPEADARKAVGACTSVTPDP
jgi:hypothetical protein